MSKLPANGNQYDSGILSDIEAALESPESPESQQLLKLVCERMKSRKLTPSQSELYSRIKSALGEK